MDAKALTIRNTL